MRWLRNLMPVVVVLGILAAFVWTLVFLYDKSQAQPVVHKTLQPEVTDVVQKTVATGAIVPRREVNIMPRVSGVLRTLHVEAGQIIKEGDLIADIKIIPNVVSLNSAEARVDSAKISLEAAEVEHRRLQTLRQEQLVSQGEYNKAQLDLELARQELKAAKDNLILVRSGALRGSGKVSNQVRSTVAGMVLDLPVKEGANVIEANTFNEGTIIASVADMTDMIFQGQVDESEVGKLHDGMPVEISVGAIEGKHFAGKLEYIAPKGVDNEGTIEFEVRAAVELKGADFVRANYSATADVILARKDRVLAINESALIFVEGQPHVDVEQSTGGVERRALKLGLSDGIKVEVVEGLQEGERVRLPDSGG